MFKGIPPVMQKKSAEGDKTLELIYVKSSDVLLSSERFQEIIEKYPGFLGLGKEDYHDLCTRLLKNFTEFVQELPETRNGLFSGRGGILEHCLRRTDVGLSLLRSYFLPSEDGTLSEPQRLWAYALFSASLLQGIGKVVVDMTVHLYDQQKRPTRSWMPFENAMVGEATYYRYEMGGVYPEDFRNRSTLLLARQLMPTRGFQWLASDKEIFAIWLALLDDDIRGGPLLAPILWRADALVIQQYLEHLQIRGPKSFLEKLPFSLHDTKDASKSMVQTATDFMVWLQEKIDSGKIDLTQGPVIAVPEGLLVTQDAFKTFVFENPNYKNWQAIQTAFTGLGLHRLGTTNEIFQQYIRMNDQKSVKGMLVNAATLAQKPVNEISGYVQAPNATPSAELYVAANGQLVAQAPGPVAPPPEPAKTPFGF